MPPHIAITKLTEALQDVSARHSIVLAYLFGSYARGNADEDSDLDLAVLAEGTLSRDERHRLRLDLMHEIASALGMPLEQIDVVVLQDVPALLQINVIRGGVAVAERDRLTRLAYELSVERRYEDETPFLEKDAALTFDRILARHR